MKAKSPKGAGRRVRPVRDRAAVPEEEVDRAASARADARHASARPLESLGDEDLIAAMRASEPAALAEYFARFSPTLAQVAARLRLDGAGREECVTELLGDVAMRIVEHRVQRMRSLTDFLVRSLRNKVLNERKGDVRRERWEAEAMRVLTRAPGVADEGVVASLMSAYSRRAAEGADTVPDDGEGDDAAVTSHPARRRLLDALSAEMTDEDRQIMGWVSEWTEQRVIAGWLGMSYDSLRLRLHRLRARLVVAAKRHLAGAAAEDRVVVMRLIDCASHRAPCAAKPTKPTKVARRGSHGSAPDAAPGAEP